MMSYFLSPVAQTLIGAVGGAGGDIHKHTSIMQNRTVGVKNKCIDEEFIWKTVNKKQRRVKKA